MPNDNFRIIPHGSRQYAARIPAQAWDEHKHLLQLLDHQGCSKSHMVRILQEFEFNPTVHQLTRKLIEWNSESSVRGISNAIHPGPECTSPDTDLEPGPIYSPNTLDIDLVQMSPTAWNIHRAFSPPITSAIPISYTKILFGSTSFAVDTYNVASQIPTAKSSKSLGKPTTISSASVYSCESQETSDFRRYRKELKRGSRAKIQPADQNSSPMDSDDKASYGSYLPDLDFSCSIGEFPESLNYEPLNFEDCVDLRNRIQREEEEEDEEDEEEDAKHVAF